MQYCLFILAQIVSHCTRIRVYIYFIAHHYPISPSARPCADHDPLPSPTSCMTHVLGARMPHFLSHVEQSKDTSRQRPFHRKHTSSRLITEVKFGRARLVLGWGTAWEHRVSLASLFAPTPPGKGRKVPPTTTTMTVFYCLRTRTHSMNVNEQVK